MLLQRVRHVLPTRRRTTRVAPETIRITATGRSHEKAKGTEVIIVEARTSSGLSLDLAGLTRDGVEVIHGVAIDTTQPAPIGLKLLPGTALEFALGQKGMLYLLCHPWSGEAHLETGTRAVTVDLFSERHELRCVDMADLVPQVVAPGAQTTTNESATDHTPVGIIRITATGQHNERAKGTEVIIVEARTSSGLSVDLARLARDGVEIIHDVIIDKTRPASLGLKLLPGTTFELALGQKGMLHLLCHPWSGEAHLETWAKTVTLDLFSERHELRRVDIADLLPLMAPPDTLIATNDSAVADHVRHEARRRLTALDPYRDGNDELANTLAIYTPRWKGVSAATRNLFRCTLGIPLTPEEHPEDIGDGYVSAVSEAILERRFRTIVLSGGDQILFSLARRLKERQPHLSVRQIWHGSYLQMGEEHDWRLFLPWLEAAQSGLVDSIAAVKPGMDVFLRSLGIRSCYIQNVPRLDRTRITRSRAVDVAGMWLSGSSEYRKLPYATLLALAGLPQFSLRASGLGELGFRMIDELGIRTQVWFFEPIPHELVLQEMRQTSLTLYVTLSECMPMVPIESISCGVPCIVGPATRLYDDSYLNDRLMVDNPTDPRAIRSRIESALADYPEVFERSLAFLDRLVVASKTCLSSFLG